MSGRAAVPARAGYVNHERTATTNTPGVDATDARRQAEADSYAGPSMSDLFRLTRVDPITGVAEPVPATERVSAILDQPNARELTRSLDPQTLYGLVHEAGLDAAWELVMMASGEQAQALVDFDVWTRDDLQFDRLANWLDVLLQRDDAEFREWYDTMDQELLVAWLREHVAVFEWEEDRDVLDTIDDPVMSSPDGVYALAIPQLDDIGDLVRLLLERVYRIDIMEGHRLLEGSRWELTSDLVETTWRLREARLGDLGFVPFHEAMEVYARLDAGAWVPRARARAMSSDAEFITFDTGPLPPVDHQLQVLETRRFAERSSTFTRALAMLPQVVPEARLEAVTDAVLAQLRALVNRVHVADLGNPGDVPASRAALVRAEANLGIGLELVAGADLALAASTLARVPLREIHRAGYSATARLAHQAAQIVRRGQLTLVEGDALSLLVEVDRRLFEGLAARRPLRDAVSEARFETLAQIESAARRVARIGFVELLFFGLMRWSRDELAALLADSARVATPIVQVSLRSLFATLVLDRLLGRDRGLHPLPLGEVHAALEAARGGDDDAIGAFTAAGAAVIARRAPDDDAVRRLGDVWASEVATWLDEAIGAAAAPPAEVVAEVVVLAAESA